MTGKMPNYIPPRREKSDMERLVDAQVEFVIATDGFDTAMRQMSEAINKTLTGMFGIPEDYFQERHDIIEGKARVVSTSWDLQADQPKLLGPGSRSDKDLQDA